MTQAPAAAVLAPNLFELQGYDTQITFSSTSISGVPLLNYTDREETRNFSGTEILIEETGLGQIVTVQLKANQADEGFESLTLLVPAVQLDEKVPEVEIQTISILSKRPGLVSPAGSVQLQRYNTIHLSGTARFVVS